MKEGFLKHGDFFKYTENLKRCEILPTQRRLYTLLNTVGWAIVVLIPMISYLFKLLFSGQLVYFSIAIGIIGICKLIFSNIHNALI